MAKIRSGFVSNSSSSSFIVAFDEDCIQYDDFVKLLWNMTLGENHKTTCYDNEVDTRVLAEIVYKDYKNSKNLTKKKILEEIKMGWFEGQPEIDWKAEQNHGDEYWEKHEEECNVAAKKLADRFVKDNKGKVFKSFSYSDNDGAIFSILEHGGTFDKVPHLTISHH